MTFPGSPARPSAAAPRRHRPPDGEAAHAWHQLPGDDVLRLLGVDPAAGLGTAEAARRRERFGPNQITPRPGPPAWLRLLRQCHQPLVYLLLAAAAVTAAFGEWLDSGVILGVVLVNTITGFLQEAKAAGAIAALSRLVTSGTTVRRDGDRRRIPSRELVPGDVVLLEPGDRIGADLRLLRVNELQIDESGLTGESVPVAKQPDPLAPDTVLADRKNLAFAGTLVTSGQGEGVVWATGDKTETGRIAWLVSEAIDLSTPLTKKIARFSRSLLWVILGLAAATFVFGVVRGEPAGEMFMAAVALSVGAIPEGLPAAVTIVLAIGVSRMAKRRAIIRQLPAVETLGSTTVICSDKTGTFTQNIMVVREVFAGGETYAIGGSGHEATGDICLDGLPIDVAWHPALLECLTAGVLCNDARLAHDGAAVRVQGDPTEIALLVAGEKGGVVQATVHRRQPVVDTIPFGSAHMFRATLHEVMPAAGAGRVIYQVGAAERVLERCVDTLDREGRPAALDKEAVHRALAAMAARGLRVLALARRQVPAGHSRLAHSHVEGGLTFLGLEGMIDPPREGAIAAVRHCQQAGIAVKMITGDHLATARAVAAQMGLHGGPGAAAGGLVTLSGREIEKIAAADLPETAERTNVFARVTPEQKLRLVQALQARGHVVAMTGDGVNDAPALRQADIGVAMGVGGTEVAKNAADMILADDNFASIEAAVEEGRAIFDNLTKFIAWIIPTNLGELLLLLVAIVGGLPLPVLPLQLLWINLTDTVLGLPLAFEPKEANIMQRPPRDPARPFLTRTLVFRMGMVSLLMLAGAFWIFAGEMARPDTSLAAARTAVVNLIVLAEIVYLFNCRSPHRACFSAGFWSNPWAFTGALGMLGAQLLFTYLPIMNRLFHTAPIDGASWRRIAAAAALVFVVVEAEKWLRRAGRRPAPVNQAANEA